MSRPHPCEGCAFFYADYPDNRHCNYLFETGHRRPCEPGEGCTVRVEQKGKRPRQRMRDYWNKKAGRP